MAARRSVSTDDLALVTFALASALLLIALFTWGRGEALREERANLIADTRAPQLLDVSAGWFSPTAEEEFAAYYPSIVRAHPGDTIRFTNPTVEDPHSVTFGLRRDRSNQPRFGTDHPLPNVNGPCVSDAALTASDRACHGLADVVDLPAFNGQAYFNSGIVPPGGGVFELRLADDLATGSYEFACVIHPGQVGTIQVVEPGEPTQRPDDLARAAAIQIEGDVDDLDAIRRAVDRADLEPGPSSVQAGAASDRGSFNVFLPNELAIDIGDTVTWTNSGSVPHVVIFGGHLAAPEAILVAPTASSGSRLRDGLFTTGPIGVPPYPATAFSVRFDQPGSYSYVCAFHPGMVGSVTVRYQGPQRVRG